MIKAEHLTFDYKKRDEEGKVVGRYRAIDELDFELQAGQFIAILGHNGSGKSTLAKHMNAILTPTGGTMWVAGKDTKKSKNIWDIRQSAGMVFQNPDNQIIATVVEEDVGFGPENLGVPTDEIWKRVEESLSAVDMLEYRYHSPNKLSGGQKQRVAIAGVMAIRPSCIVLDEPTAMLDPNGRKEVLAAIEELRRRENITVILITHYMEEVVGADRVLVMDKGHIVMDGAPREIFSQVERLKELRLDVPQVTLLAHELQQKGLMLPDGILTMQELADAICTCKDEMRAEKSEESMDAEKQKASIGCRVSGAEHTKGELLLEAEHLEYVYSEGTAYEKTAISDVNLRIYEDEFLGIIGHTGSGKSTLIQHLNGLLKASGGTLRYRGEDVYDEKYEMRKLRNEVGLVFQYPEHQLFEVDVLSDVCFGPKNQGLSPNECKERAKEALRLVGLSEKYDTYSPFDLSGGQKRRVAIAGVLAMKPKILVLDEPTAGLDPKGRDEILDQITKLQRQEKLAVVLVSHSMEDIAKYVDRIVVMNRGRKMYDAEPKDVFSHYKELEKIGLAAPQVTYVMHMLRERGLPVRTQATTITEAAEEIVRVV